MINKYDGKLLRRRLHHDPTKQTTILQHPVKGDLTDCRILVGFDILYIYTNELFV